MGITKEKIVHVAKSMILTNGVGLTDMKQVADTAGITTAELETFFPSKEALVEASTEVFFMEFEQLTDTIYNKSTANAIEKWFSLVTGITAVMQLANKESIAVQLRENYPIIFGKAQLKQWEILKKTFQANIFQGMKEGLFKIDFDTDLFMRFYFLGLLNIEQSDLLKETSYTYAQLKVEFLSFQIKSIATEEGLHVLEEVLESKYR